MRVPVRRVHDVRFAPEHAPVGVDRYQEGVGAIGHVLDQARRQTDKSGVRVHRLIEAPLRLQVETREHQIADAAVIEVERAPRGRELTEECSQRCADCGGGFSAHAADRLTALVFLEAGGERGDRGAVGSVRQPAIERSDQRRRTRPQFGRDTRRILPEIRRSESVAEEAADLTRGRPIVVAVDGDCQVHAGRRDQRRGQRTGPSAA